MQLNKNLLAAGIGGLLGGAYMGTDDSPFAVLAGAGIGAATGAMLDLDLTGLSTTVARKNNATVNKIPDELVAGKKLTFNQKKQEVQRMAENLAKKSSNTNVPFDSSKPFSTLNPNTISDFTNYLSNIDNIETLNKIKLSLTNKSDDIFVAAKDLNGIPTVTTNSYRIREDAELKEKIKAIKMEFKRLGVKDSVAQKEAEKFIPLLKQKLGMMQISGGSIKFANLKNEIKLPTVLSDGKTLVHVSKNNDVYDLIRANPLGLLSIQDQGMIDSVKANAKGILMADAFKKAEAGKGLLPHQVAALAGELTSDTKVLDNILGYSNSLFSLNSQVTGEYKKELASGNRLARPPVTGFSQTKNSFVSLEKGFVFQPDGTLSDIPFRAATVVSNDGVTESEVKQMVKKWSTMTGQISYTTKADDSALVVEANNARNNLGGFTGALERNHFYTNSREVIFNNNSTLGKLTNKILENTGLRSVYSSATGLLSFAAGPEKPEQLDFSDKLARVYGTDTTIADGFGLANRKVTDNIVNSSTNVATLEQNFDGTFSVFDEKLRNIATGVETISEATLKAKQASLALPKNVQTALEKTYQRVEDFKTAATANTPEAIFDYLKNNIKGFSKYKDLAEFQLKNKKYSQAQDKVGFLTRIAEKSLIPKRLLQPVFTENQVQYNHLDIVQERTKFNKQFKQQVQNVVKNGVSYNSDVLQQLIEDNEQRLEYKPYMVAIYPRPGKTLGVNPNGDVVDLKHHAHYYKLENVFSDQTTNPQVGSSTKRLNFVYNQRTVLGHDTNIKSFADAAKVQLLNKPSNVFAEYTLLQHLFNKGNAQIDKKGVLSLILSDENKPVKFSLGKLKRTPLLDLIQQNGNTTDLDIAKKSYKFFEENVATVADEGTSGQKAINKAFDVITEFNKTKDPTKLDNLTRNPNSAIRKTIESYANSKTLTVNEIKGLSRFAVAMSTEKLSAPLQYDLFASMRQTASYKVGQYTAAVNSGDAQTINNTYKALEDFSRDVLKLNLNPSMDVKSINNVVTSEIEAIEKNIVSFVSNSSNLFDSQSGSTALDDIADLFAKNNTYRLDADYDTTHVLSSFSMRPKGVAGFGGEEKSMSWSSNRQLLLNGFTTEELNTLGRYSAATLSDINSIISMVRPFEKVINTQITDANRNQFLQAMYMSSDKRRDALKQAGFDIDDSEKFLMYKLKDDSKQGFKNIPIFLEDSNLVGSYTNAEGFKTEKGLSKVLAEAINLDLSIQSGKLSDVDLQAKTNLLEKQLEILEQEIKPVLAGSNNIAKEFLKRDVPVSRYVSIQPAAGAFNTYLKKSGKSAMAVSEDYALQTFRQLGYNYNSIDDLRKNGHLISVGNGLEKLRIDKDTPFFQFFTREPAVGPGSTRLMDVIVDKTVSDRDGSKIFLSHSDAFYKLLQFGDHDLDGGIVLTPQFKGKFDKQIFKDMYDKGDALNKKLTDLTDFAKYLGVKGKDKDTINSLFDAVADAQAQAGRSLTFDEASSVYFDQQIASKFKGGDRKSLAAPTTKFVSDLNAAITKEVQNGANTDVGMRARVLSHYIVENIIKSQHISNSRYLKEGVTEGEILINAFNNASDKDKSYARLKLTEYVENNIIPTMKNQGRDDLVVLAREALSLITNGIKNNNSDVIETPQHLSKQKPIKQGIEDLSDLVYGKSPTVNAAGATEEIVNDINKSVAKAAKVGYDTTLESAKTIFSKNKTILAGAAAAAVGSALLFQQKPDFGNKHINADPGAMNLAPSQAMYDDSSDQVALLSGLQKPTEYIRTYKDQPNNNINIQAGRREDSNNSGSNYIMGDMFSSARVINL